jgi:putative PIN family toxin of toxin-antitoxin system
VLRVVVDTNIFVSAQLSRNGVPAQLLRAWREHRFVLLTSPAITVEITETLAGFIGRAPYAVSQGDVDEVVTLLKTVAVEVPGSAAVTDAVIPDPDDLVFLACAVDGGADFIASGDKHLKALKVYRNMPILTARELLDRLDQQV